MKLWEGLVSELSLGTSMQQRILSSLEKVDKTKQKHLHMIDFKVTSRKLGSHMSAIDDLRQSKLIELQRKFDNFAGQLHFVNWLMTVPKFKLDDI
jgi:hypothetical protein